MKVLEFSDEQEKIFLQLADLALKGCGVQAYNSVQSLSALLASAKQKDDSADKVD